LIKFLNLIPFKEINKVKITTIHKKMNTVELVLQVYGNKGMSMRNLKNATGLSKRSIKYQIYCSRFIEDAVPLTYGSGKCKIQVYNYTPIESLYLKRRIKKVETSPEPNVLVV